MAQILVVEDDADIANMLSVLLTSDGHEPHVAYSGSEALLLLQRQRFDLILLDLMLPGRSGLEVLGELRAAKATQEATPVIMLTAVTDKETVVRLLGAGANDYITKPFDNVELLARVRVQLRAAGDGDGDGLSGGNADGDSGSGGTQRGRTPLCHGGSGSRDGSGGSSGGGRDGGGASGDGGERNAPGLLRYKNLLLDTEAFSALVDGRPAGLSKTEFSILRLLMGNPRKVFIKDRLYESVWGGRFMGDDNTINVHISKLRAKLAALDPDTDYITTVWGIGFKMS
ncbi:MAG: response regulator transcription factor [Coriobacteriales bacterium]|jgi:DNA-binding response OmpR family regulator|nr:response regulator transcription factor [Coriobacteriales bacterium]